MAANTITAFVSSLLILTSFSFSAVEKSGWLRRFDPVLVLNFLLQYLIKHDITLSGVGKMKEAKQLPSARSIPDHFNPKSNTRVYADLEINYTTFFSEKIRTIMTSFSLKNSTGLDADLNKDGYFNANHRATDIDPWILSSEAGTHL